MDWYINQELCMLGWVDKTMHTGANARSLDVLVIASEDDSKVQVVSEQELDCSERRKWDSRVRRRFECATLEYVANPAHHMDCLNVWQASYDALKQRHFMMPDTIACRKMIESLRKY